MTEFYYVCIGCGQTVDGINKDGECNTCTNKVVE